MVFHSDPGETNVRATGRDVSSRSAALERRTSGRQDVMSRLDQRPWRDERQDARLRCVVGSSVELNIRAVPSFR